MAQPPVLSLEGMALQQGGKWLFGDAHQSTLDLHVGPRDRLALIGRNGAGKTTLFRLIDNQIEADRGERKVKPGLKIVLLEQDPDFTGRQPEAGTVDGRARGRGDCRAIGHRHGDTFRRSERGRAAPRRDCPRAGAGT